MEDKQRICDLFLVTLQETRDGANIVDLTYDRTTEFVTITFGNGYTKHCNVNCDSGIAMILDILRCLGL